MSIYNIITLEATIMWTTHWQGRWYVVRYHSNRPRLSYKTTCSATHKLHVLCFTQSCIAVCMTGPLHIWKWVTTHNWPCMFGNTCNKNHCFQALGLSMYSQYVLVHKDAYMHALWGVMWKVLQDRVNWTWGSTGVQWCVEAWQQTWESWLLRFPLKASTHLLGIQEAVHLNGRCPTNKSILWPTTKLGNPTLASCLQLGLWLILLNRFTVQKKGVRRRSRQGVLRSSGLPQVQLLNKWEWVSSTFV